MEVAPIVPPNCLLEKDSPLTSSASMASRLWGFLLFSTGECCAKRRSQLFIDNSLNYGDITIVYVLFTNF